MIIKNKNVFYHRGSIGDIIYAIPTILACGGNAVLYLRDKEHLKFLYGLLMKQSYVIDVRYVGDVEKYGHSWTDGSIINLSGFAHIAWAKRDQHLVLSHLETQNKEYDLSKLWIDSVEPKYLSDIIINRTTHYHDKEEIDWHLLEPFKDRCKFIGYTGEYKRFVKTYKIDIEFYQVQDALEVAQVIKGSKFFIGNQSVAFAIAEALKHPRSLEVCYAFNNCQPHGEDGYTYLTSDLINRYLDKGNNDEEGRDRAN